MKKILVLVLCFIAFFANATAVEKNFNSNPLSKSNVVILTEKLPFVQDTIKNESTTVKKVVDQPIQNSEKTANATIIPSQGFYERVQSMPNNSYLIKLNV